MAGCASLAAKAPDITVVYPKEGDTIGAVDSNFIFGSVTPGARLEINGYSVTVYEDGGYLAYLPVESGAFTYYIQAVLGGDTTHLNWTITVPRLKKASGYDSLDISPIGGPDQIYSLRTGDIFRFGFKGTPGCEAWAEIPGIADSIPMSEQPPQEQPFWGKSVFGAGAVPDSVKIPGIYSGFYQVGTEKSDFTLALKYHLRGPSLNRLMTYLRNRPEESIDFDILNLIKLNESIITQHAPYRLKLNPSSFPRGVIFADSVQRIRVAPGKGYLSILQPRGSKAVAVGEEGDWYRLLLSENTYGWLQKGSTEDMPAGILPKISYLKSLRLFREPDEARIEIPLSERHPYRIEETAIDRLSLYLYGVNSDTDWIRYDSDDPDVEFMQWAQPEQGLYRLDIKLKRPLWGYDLYYMGTVLNFSIVRPPEDVQSLRGKTIVIDPGHSPELGAVGPTGLSEKEINLVISKKVAEELLKKGAKVVLTRPDSLPLALYDRPVIANTAGADLFVSIHNNALPDGVNPFDNNGSSVYYYHRHSFELAAKIYDRLVDATKLPRHGLYHGNLAVIRPTEYPAVLIECAFMMIPEQESKLREKSFQDKIAKAITKGIEDFLKNYDS